MKIVERIKKGLMGIGVFLLTIPTKVFAINDSMRGIAIDPAYGIPDPVKPVRNNIISNILNICRMFIIPIALLIGIIIYFKKSKSSKKRKIITVLITICIVAILYLVINYIINNVI